MRKHVDLLRDMDNVSLASSARTTHSLSMYGRSTPQSEVEDNHDLSCLTGREAYFSARKPCHITKDRMEGSYFARRLDGLRHEWVHALRDNHCQYCYYVWANDFDDAQRDSFRYKKQNRKNIIRCLVCNVNLCWACDHEFHGVEMTSSAT